AAAQRGDRLVVADALLDHEAAVPPVGEERVVEFAGVADRPLPLEEAVALAPEPAHAVAHVPERRLRDHLSLDQAVECACPLGAAERRAPVARPPGLAA